MLSPWWPSSTRTRIVDDTSRNLLTRLVWLQPQNSRKVAPMFTRDHCSPRLQSDQAQYLGDFSATELARKTRTGRDEGQPPTALVCLFKWHCVRLCGHRTCRASGPFISPKDLSCKAIIWTIKHLEGGCGVNRGNPRELTFKNSKWQCQKMVPQSLYCHSVQD